MRKLIIVALVLVLVASTVSVFAQQPGDYVTVKKSDLPPDVLKKIQTVQAAENPKPTTTNKGQWFFLLYGSAGGLSAIVFVMAGPFKDQADCNELNAWAKGKHATASKCWYSGN